MESIAIDVFHQHPDLFMSLTATRPTSTSASWPPQLFAIIIFLHHSANKQRSATSCTSFADRNRILYLNDLIFAFEPRWGQSICTIQWNTYQNQINYKSKERSVQSGRWKRHPFLLFNSLVSVMHSTPSLFCVTKSAKLYNLSPPPSLFGSLTQLIASQMRLLLPTKT